MLYNLNELRYIIEQSILLTEKSGVIDDEYSNIADSIIDRIYSGENFFYVDVPDNDFIIVSVKNKNKISNKVNDSEYEYNMSFSPNIKTLSIWYVDRNREIFKSKIIHELTHYVNTLKSDSLRKSMTSLSKDKLAMTAEYLFNPSEINARISEFYYWLKASKRNIKSISEANSVLKIYEMLNVIQELKNDNFEDMQDSLTVELYKYYNKVKDIPFGDKFLYKFKEKLINYYIKIWKKYIKKALNVLGRYKTESNQINSTTDYFYKY